MAVCNAPVWSSLAVRLRKSPAYEHERRPIPGGVFLFDRLRDVCEIEGMKEQTLNAFDAWIRAVSSKIRKLDPNGGGKEFNQEERDLLDCLGEETVE